MKYGALFMGIVTIFFCTYVYASSSKNKIPEDEIKQILCGTWVNPEYSNGIHCAKNIYYSDGIWEAYALDTGDRSYGGGTYTIEEAWTDNKGNIWCKLFMTYNTTAGSSETEFFRLTKISNAGTVYESVQDASDFPSEFEPENIRYTYLQYYRK